MGTGNTYSSSSKQFEKLDPNATPSKSIRFPAIGDRPRIPIKNLEDLKNRPDLIRFYIRQKFGADIPCNAKLESYKQGDDQHHKIEKYLTGKGKSDNDVIMLAYLYDDHLREIDGLKYTDALVAKSNLPRSQTRTRITEILNIDNRYRRSLITTK